MHSPVTPLSLPCHSPVTPLSLPLKYIKNVKIFVLSEKKRIFAVALLKSLYNLNN